MNKTYTNIKDFYVKEIMPNLQFTDGYLAMDNNGGLYWYENHPIYVTNEKRWDIEKLSDTCDYIDNYKEYFDKVHPIVSMHSVEFLIKESEQPMKKEEDNTTLYTVYNSRNMYVATLNDAQVTELFDHALAACKYAKPLLINGVKERLLMNYTDVIFKAVKL